MAWREIQKDMNNFFINVANGVREDMDAELIHIIDYDYNTLATGFAKAAKAMGSQDPNLEKNFKVAVRNLMDPWQKGGGGKLQPGDVFRKQPSTGKKGGMVNVPIPNAKVLKNESQKGQKVTLIIQPAGATGMGYKPTNLNKHIRKEVWKEYNATFATPLPAYDTRKVGQHTPFAHDQQSTVGLAQMHKLGDAQQNEPDNPFTDAEAFMGKIGGHHQLNMQTYISNLLIGQGASNEFREETVPNASGVLEKQQVVRGTFSGRNYPGSEITDKRKFNQYIVKYYQEKFWEAFDADTIANKKKKAKGWGYDSVDSFRGSPTFREVKEQELLNRVGTNLAKSSASVKASVPKKPKPTRRRKAFKPKQKAKRALTKKSDISVNKRGRVQKRRTKSGKLDMRFKENRHSPIALTQLLNKVLPDELRKRMTGVYPRGLEWRTGRFGQSAEVKSIVPFPKLTQIQYTYQKDPYQVFEAGSGNPLASSGRDPQKIIGGTIRELAQSIMGDRFGLVRTKRI